MILLKSHDPGFPVGKILSAALFTSPDGINFIAAVLGFYQGSKKFSFEDLNLGPITPSIPSYLPDLTDEAWIEFGVDPREVGEMWVADALNDSPLRVKQKKRSHNAAEVVSQLVSIGLPYAILVWNPFVKAIATEAGKDTYVAMKKWLGKLFGKLPELSNPIVEIASIYKECQVSFIIRGGDVMSHYAALEALSVAAQTAATLVQRMTLAGFPPVRLTYEYYPEEGSWQPSFAELKSGRFITDNAKLIEINKLPLGLSIGVVIED